MIDHSFFGVSKRSEIDRDKINAALENWTAFNAALPKLALDELYVAFRLECTQLGRERFVSRLIQRIRVKSADRVEAFLREQQQQITS